MIIAIIACAVTVAVVEWRLHQYYKKVCDLYRNLAEKQDEDFASLVDAVNDVNEWKIEVDERLGDTMGEFDGKLVQGLENLLKFNGGMTSG